MHMMTRASVLTLLIAGLLFPLLSAAENIDTLEKFRKTKVITAGVRDNTLPFSTMGQGSPNGYAVDLCNRIADQARKDLKLPDLKIQYVPVTAAERFAKLKDGSIDIECTLSVNTKSRAEVASFSFTHFVGGERFLSRKDSNIRTLDDLAGKAVAIPKGTTAEKLFTLLRDGQIRNMQLVQFATNGEAFKALEAGKVAAFAQLDIVLESQRLQSKTPEKFVLSDASLSVEPMAMALRKDDAPFRAIADKALASLYSSGEINGIYEKWFNTGTLRFPVSRMLRECFTRPSHEPGVAIELGYQL